MSINAQINGDGKGRGTYFPHFRAPGQLWIRFWMVGWENPKKSAPDGTMEPKELPLRPEGGGQNGAFTNRPTAAERVINTH